MKPFVLIVAFITVLATAITVPPCVDPASAQDDGARAPLPEGVYVDLTRDFYEALQRDAGRSATVYSNDPSSTHLREIAVSTRFMVQTNLEILKQQEEMIQLLRRLLEKR